MQICANNPHKNVHKSYTTLKLDKFTKNCSYFLLIISPNRRLIGAAISLHKQVTRETGGNIFRTPENPGHSDHNFFIFSPVKIWKTRVFRFGKTQSFIT